jgi:molecular chaperone GrpE (heat shock protein)
VSLQQWQAAMNDYGINRVSQGAQAKAAKFETAMNSLLPFIDRLRATVRAMPDNTPADREQRALAMIRGMRAYQRPSS